MLRRSPRLAARRARTWAAARASPLSGGRVLRDAALPRLWEDDDASLALTGGFGLRSFLVGLLGLSPAPTPNPTATTTATIAPLPSATPAGPSVTQWPTPTRIPTSIPTHSHAPLPSPPPGFSPVGTAYVDLASLAAPPPPWTGRYQPLALVDPSSTPVLSAQVGRLWSVAYASRAAMEEALATAATAAGGRADVVVAPVKAFERGIEKIEVDYGGDVTRLTDVLRGAILVDSLADLQAVHRAVMARLLVTSFKDRMSHPLPSGYRDHMYTFRLDNGLVAELQVLLRDVYEYKVHDGHAAYEKARKIMARAARAQRGLTADERTRLRELDDEQAAAYAAMWARYSAPAGPASSASASAVRLVRS